MLSRNQVPSKDGETSTLFMGQIQPKADRGGREGGGGVQAKSGRPLLNFFPNFRKKSSIFIVAKFFNSNETINIVRLNVSVRYL